MNAEVLYGERLHAEETNLLDRDSRLGKKHYPTADRMLQESLSKIGEPHDYEFKVFILKNSTRNAVARPGGFLYIDQGLIEDPAGHPKAYFAFAHEVAHVLQRHETKELQSMIVDSISSRDELVKTIFGVKKDPRIIFTHVKAKKNLFTRHHVDQELQADSCAAKLLSRVFPDLRSLANSLNAFLKDLPAPERTQPQPPPKSETDKLAATVHDIVDTPINRHPSSEERYRNLRAIYNEIMKENVSKGQ
jgi:predicted Zn-dependent protease